MAEQLPPATGDAATRWTERYLTAAAEPARPPAPFVTSLAPLLDGLTTAIDLGGGTGRNARWLADRGLAVTVADIASPALAAIEQPDITTVHRDLEVDGWPDGQWDLALFHYFFDRALFAASLAHLNSGGLLVVAQPTVTNLERHERPSRRFLLGTGELAALTAELPIEPLLLHEGWTDEGRHEARLVARVRS